MRRSALGAPLILAAAALAAVSAAKESDPERIAAPERLLIEGRTDLPLDLSSGRPVVGVRIHEEGPTPLVFDTGGVGLMVDADLAEELGLEVVGVGRMSSPLGDGDGIEVRQARIERMDLGGVTLVGLLADLWSGDPLFHGVNRPRGVFGITLLRDSLVTLDFPKNRLSIETGALPEAGPGIIELASDQGLPVVQVDVAGVRVAAHFDTGNPGSLHLPLAMSDRLPLKGPPRLIGRARTVDASVGVYAATLAGPVTVGDRRFEDLDVQFLEGSTWANVGMGLLRRFSVTFDLRNQRARLEEPGGPD